MTREEMREALQSVPVDRRLAVVFALRPDLKQQDIADKAGMTESLFSRVASGRRDAADDERRSIAKAIGLSVADLFGDEVEAAQS